MIDNSTRGRSEPPKSDDGSKRKKVWTFVSWFHKYLFHYRCGFHHPCHPSTSIFMRYRMLWSLTSTTKCDILPIITGWLSWYLAHVDWIGIQFNNEGLDMFLCTLSQSSLMSNWFTNRFQIWMIIIRCRRTCPALLSANLTWMTNWSSTRTSTGTGSTVELDDRQLYRCIRLHVFNSSKTVSFILPDDKFKLMRYVFLIGPAINGSTIDGYRLTSITTLPLCFHHQWNRHQPSTVYGCNQGNKPSAIKRCAWDSNTTSVDCKAANVKASRECGGMKTAQSAHSRGRRI